MLRTIVTVSGKDSIGVIAKICTFFEENRINILDVSQKSIDDRLYLMMVVDIEGYHGSFKDLVDRLDSIGKGMGYSIKAQHEEIFDMMHRI